MRIKILKYFQYFPRQFSWHIQFHFYTLINEICMLFCLSAKEFDKLPSLNNNSTFLGIPAANLNILLFIKLLLINFV